MSRKKARKEGPLRSGMTISSALGSFEKRSQAFVHQRPLK
jgi:hypothetical protein